MRKVNSFENVKENDIVFIEKRQTVHRITFSSPDTHSFVITPFYTDKLEQRSRYVTFSDLILDFYILDTTEEITMYELGASNFDLCKSK